MYSTSINDETGLTPDHVTHAHSPQEAEIEFIPNLSQIEAEAELLGNICTGTPSPPPRPLNAGYANRYAEWDPSPSPIQEAQNAMPLSQPGGPQEPPTLTFTNAQGAWISIRGPTPCPLDPPMEYPTASLHQKASPGKD